MVEDDDDSDYGHSKKKGSKKVIRRGRPEKKEKKSPKPRLKATGETCEHVAYRHVSMFVCSVTRSKQLMIIFL